MLRIDRYVGGVCGEEEANVELLIQGECEQVVSKRLWQRSGELDVCYVSNGERGSGVF